MMDIKRVTAADDEYFQFLASLIPLSVLYAENAAEASRKRKHDGKGGDSGKDGEDEENEIAQPMSKKARNRQEKKKRRLEQERLQKKEALKSRTKAGSKKAITSQNIEHLDSDDEEDGNGRASQKPVSKLRKDTAQAKTETKAKKEKKPKDKDKVRDKVKEKNPKSRSKLDHPVKQHDPELEKKLETKLGALRAAREAKSEHKKELKDKKRQLRAKGHADKKSWKQSMQSLKANAQDAVPPRIPLTESEQKNQAKAAQVVGQQPKRTKPPGDELEFNIEGLEEKKKKRLIVKKRDLPKMMERAQRARERLEELKATPEGKQLAMEKTIKTALARATGEKVLDDVKLLKKSVKSWERQKKKSTKSWEDRLKTEKTLQRDKAEKREKNIRTRVEKIKQKKSSKRK